MGTIIKVFGGTGGTGGSNTDSAYARQQGDYAKDIYDTVMGWYDGSTGFKSAAETLLSKLESLVADVYNATYAANRAYALITQIEGVDVYSHIPASLVVSYDAEVPLGASPTIGKMLFPSTANQSVVFISKDVDVTPDGVVSSPAEAGDATIYVVSTEQSKLWQKVTIHFRALVARTTEDGTARTAEDGTSIEC